MKICLIAALAQNRVVGINNQLPWHLPEDLKYFRRTTTGKTVIMGRKTYDSIGRPLPNRSNIVVSRNPACKIEHVQVVSSLPAALELAENISLVNGVDEIMVIGGATLYEAALPVADRLYLTLVHAEVEGDAYFPAVDFSAWREVAREDFAASEHNPYPYSFVVYDKI